MLEKRFSRAGKRGGRRGLTGQMRELMGSDFVKKHKGLIKDMASGDADLLEMREAFGDTFRGGLSGMSDVAADAEGGFDKTELDSLVNAALDKYASGTGAGTQKRSVDLGSLIQSVERLATTTGELQNAQRTIAATLKPLAVVTGTLTGGGGSAD